MNSPFERVLEEQINGVTLMVSPKNIDSAARSDTDAGNDLISFTRDHRHDLDKRLAETPAMLFRGFKNFKPDGLAELSGVFSDPIDYVYRSTPRTELSKGVYTATEYPNDSTIPQHCENAYQNRWPLKLFFYCEQSAETGGETPLSDVRKVTAALPKALTEKFRKYGVMYVRNYSPGLDIPWQTVFQTEHKNEVEKFCDANGITYEWTGSESLKTTQICQALSHHPMTNEEVWFNQAHLFHYTNLEPDLREFLIASYGEEGLPRNACYGNGESIDDADLDIIRRAFEDHKSAFKWQDGDTLLIDNMLCSHGRNPFSGKRKVLVSMAGLFSDTENG